MSVRTKIVRAVFFSLIFAVVFGDVGAIVGMFVSRAGPYSLPVYVAEGGLLVGLIFGFWRGLTSGALTGKSILGWGTAIVLLTVLTFILIANFQGYRARGLVNEAIQDALPVRQRVSEFYVQNHRLPVASEANALQRNPRELGWVAKSVRYDPIGRMIVITMRDDTYPGYAGKRLAFRVEERGRELVWTCATIDVEMKYLPGSCR